MKINKIEISGNKETLTVWTSAFPLKGYGFRTDEIIDEDDLIVKVKQRLNEEVAQIQSKENNQTKFDQIKSLEGCEL